MRLLNLIKEGTPTQLTHPIVGDVDWVEDSLQGWCLLWPQGPDKGQLLVADHAVLFDTDWSLREEPTPQPKCRLERLGWELRPVYTSQNNNCFLGYYWYDGTKDTAKRMFHKDSWMAELMNREEE